jgi:hypothetical protein
MKRVLGIILALMLVIGMILPAGVMATPDLKTIEVKDSTLDQQDSCTNGVVLWQFAINQINNLSNAPATIHVIWDDLSVENVPLDKFVGKVAHYTTILHAGAKVTDATAAIYNAWNGNFNLSHVVCNSITTACKTGMKFNDINENGIFDNNEWGLPGWTIYVDYNNNSVKDTSEPFAVTDLDGLYVITGITPGTWKVREVSQFGWTCKLPTVGYYEEIFTAGNIQTGNDFGNSNPNVTTSEIPEVGGTIFPLSKAGLIAPLIAMAVAIVTGTVIIIKRRVS